MRTDVRMAYGRPRLLRRVPEVAHDAVHQPGGLVHRRAARWASRRADPDLEMRRVGLADRTAADVGDRLPGGHVVADVHQRRLGMSVVDVAPRVLAAVDLQHGGVRAEPVDSLLHDRAGGDRYL